MTALAFGKKKCRQCGRVLGLSAFHKTKASRDGRNARCKECFNAGKRARYERHGECCVFRMKTKNGYVLIRNEHGWTTEHKAVMQRALGRELVVGETVHHKNGRRDDNRVSNLELWASAHHSGQRVSDLIRDALKVLSEYGPDPTVYEGQARMPPRKDKEIQRNLSPADKPRSALEALTEGRKEREQQLNQVNEGKTWI